MVSGLSRAYLINVRCCGAQEVGLRLSIYDLPVYACEAFVFCYPTERGGVVDPYTFFLIFGFSGGGS